MMGSMAAGSLAADVKAMASCLTAEGYVIWWLERTGSVSYKHFDHPNEYVGCVSNTHQKFGSPGTFTSEQLHEAVESLHDDGRAFRIKTLVRGAIAGKKTYPAEYCVAVQLR